MMFRHNRVLLGAGLVVLLMALGYPFLPNGILYRFQALRHLNKYLETDKPVAIHQNPGGKSKGVACVVEPSIGNCRGTGFASLLLMTIDDLATCLVRGFTPTVVWSDCEYCGSPGHNKNYWTWYFEAINPGIEEEAKTSVCMGPMRYHVDQISIWETRTGGEGNLVDFRFADMENKISSYSPPITAEVSALVSYVISGYIKPAPRIRKMVDTFYQSFMAGRINIGVHVRLGNDHLEEMSDEEQEAPELQDFLQVVKKIIDDVKAEDVGDKPVRIFLASDDHEVNAAFKDEFGKDKVVHAEGFRGDEVIDKLGRDKAVARQFGDEVLVDILLLSKCDYLVHDESNVASVAYYFNPKMRSYFVSGDAADHKRLNGQSCDSTELFRLAVAKETSIIRDLPEMQRGFLNTGPKVTWDVLSDMEETISMIMQLKCFNKNIKWSKCRKEFAASKFADRNSFKALMGL
ncbi:uncharacterized protein [Branchiostoma lanceolatum]|uniref:uncharacterized protein n=1 Tax=Branchiostoma lanceolatum TaxID=7740 RepID=UPI003456FD9B